mgnify:CR=1 FL=1
MSIFRKNKYIALGILSFCSSLLIGCQGINSYQAIYYLNQAYEILGDTGRELEVINLANKKKIPIVFTKIRHFKH